MTKDEKAEDYDRLQYEFTQLNQELKSQKRANKKLKEQLLLHNVVKQSEQFNCYEMHTYSRFDGCNKQCKECADNEKSKAI